MGSSGVAVTESRGLGLRHPMPAWASHGHQLSNFRLCLHSTPASDESSTESLFHVIRFFSELECVKVLAGKIYW